MASIQVKNVPERLHHRLMRYARRSQRSMRAVIIEAIEHQLASQEFHDRLVKRSRTALAVPAASLLQEGRRNRAR